MAAKDKDTIYIDIDDEITGIIDKLKVSESKVVALVLPKRASVFQSIVNMKLLKRAADGADKNLVLITSEASLLPLAGAAGIHVAKTLTSKPAIPLGPQGLDDAEEAIEEPAELGGIPDDADKTVGQLAGNTPPPPPADGGVETLTLDDDLPPEEAAPAASKAAKAASKAKGKKNKKFRIPNFERFRLLLILVALAFILIIGILIYVTVALPKATITIKTDATNVDTNLNLNLSTDAKSLDPSTNTLPAKLASQQKTYSQQVPTTGQKNNGNKAQGSVVFYNCDANDTLSGTNETIPAGTGLSNNGSTYITQQSVSVPPSHFSGSQCKSDQASSSVNVIAQSGGSSSNTSGNSTFSVAYANSTDGSHSFSATTPTGISGGSDNIVQIVNQNDITSAKNKITTDDNAMKQALESQLKGENEYPIAATYTASAPVVSTSAAVGDQASSVTVTEVITYNMFGVSQNDINTLITNQINTQIDTSKQSVLDTGLGQATFNINTISNTSSQLTMSTKAIAGPTLDITTIKQQAAGKHTGEIKSQLSNNPDVTSVDVSLSPFWISSAPKKTSRITVKIAKPTTTKGSSSSANNP